MIGDRFCDFRKRLSGKISVCSGFSVLVGRLNHHVGDQAEDQNAHADVVGRNHFCDGCSKEQKSVLDISV